MGKSKENVTKTKNNKYSKFHHLHVHSTFSFLDGYGLPEQYVDRLKNLDMDGMALTDHGSTWGHVPFFKAMTEAGLHPILGNEFYYVMDAEDRSRGYYHLTILAMNNLGLKNLYKLQSFANFEGMYYKPRIDQRRLKEFNDGLIVLSGCMGNGFPITHIDNPELVKQWMTEMVKIFGDRFYVEVSPIEKYQKQVTKIIRLAEELKIPYAATSDVHFPAAEDHTAEDILLSIGLKADYHDGSRMQIMPELYLFNNTEARERCEEVFGNRWTKAWDAADEIYSRCSVNFEEAKPLHFFSDDLANVKALKEFDRLIEEGYKFRNIQPTGEYKARVEREVGLIKEKGFVNYFLIISDLVRWAKSRMVVGPARGSAAGSLVAYLLRITEVDPLKHGLIFERFIDITRKDLPDIDLDFPHKRRDEILDYLISRYGEDYVSLLGTVAYFKSKNAIWDVGRIFNLPFNARKELAEQIIERSSGDSRASFCVQDSIDEIERARKIVEQYPEFKLAAKIEGQVRQSGIHAAAMVISKDPLDQFGSFVKDKGGEHRVLCMDKKAAESLNLLKIDILALKQLTVIEHILESIGKNNDWLYALPLEDPKAYQVLRDRLFNGVFQFEGDALKAVSIQSNPDDFHSMSEISALARPGSLHCGGTTEYLDRRAWYKRLERKTKKPAKYIHPLVEAVSKETYGVIVYQEQVMQLMREVGGMSWEDTAKIRRLISKSMGVEYFNTFLDKFRTGALERGLSEDDVSEVWHQIATFGSWAFNKSHSISYGYISYWTLYLKAHHPAEFYVASLREESDDNSIKYLLREWIRYFGGKFVPLHPEHSKDTFHYDPDSNTIYGGFSNIKGIGDKAAEKILSARETSDSRKSFQKAIGKKNFEILSAMNCIPNNYQRHQLNLFNNDPILTRGYEPPPQEAVQRYAEWADLTPIGDEWDVYYKEKNFKYISDITDATERIRLIGKLKTINLRSMKETTVTQKLLKGKGFKDEHLDKFFNLVIEDDTGVIFLGVNRYIFPKYKDMIFNAGVGAIIAIEGKKLPGFLKISVEKLKVLKNAKTGQDSE